MSRDRCRVEVVLYCIYLVSVRRGHGFKQREVFVGGKEALKKGKSLCDKRNKFATAVRAAACQQLFETNATVVGKSVIKQSTEATQA